VSFLFREKKYGDVLMNRCRPGTAMLFALTIVEVLAGKEKRDEVAGPMMVAETL
jgi:protein DJ-1